MRGISRAATAAEPCSCGGGHVLAGSVEACGDDAGLGRHGQHPDQEPGHHRSNRQTDELAYSAPLFQIFPVGIPGVRSRSRFGSVQPLCPRFADSNRSRRRRLRRSGCLVRAHHRSTARGQTRVANYTPAAPGSRSPPGGLGHIENRGLLLGSKINRPHFGLTCQRPELHQLVRPNPVVGVP
jgi:hypothetical protein